MVAGHIYILANAAVPGVMQIAKGAAMPTHAAKELTIPGGVPSEVFIVYEQFVDDADAVYQAIELSVANGNLISCGVSGLVVKMEMSDVIKVVVSAVKNYSLRVDDPDLRWNSVLNPWHELLQKGDEYYYGLGECFQDYAEALKLYREAATLDSPEAYKRLGDMYLHGEGMAKNSAKAIENYKNGLRLGNYFCLLGLAQIFLDDRHNANVIKAFSRFLELGRGEGWQSYADFPNQHAFSTYHLLVDAALSQHDIYFQLLALSEPFYPALRLHAEKSLRDRSGKDSKTLIDIRQKILEDVVSREKQHD